MSYDVARRTSEIGIRIALGAGRSDVLRLVLRETIIVVLIGASLGLGAAVAGAQLARSVLFGVEPTDPVTMGSAILLLATVATLAGFVPARRASRLDQTEALRYE